MIVRNHGLAVRPQCQRTDHDPVMQTDGAYEEHLLFRLCQQNCLFGLRVYRNQLMTGFACAATNPPEACRLVKTSASDSRHNSCR